MPPRVEQLRPAEGLKDTNYFIVDLKADEQEFDQEKFDSQRELVTSGDLIAKFVVINDQLIIFPFHNDHSNFYRFIRNAGFDGELQCAGQFKRLHPREVRVMERWNFSGYSGTLEQEKLLSEKDSEKYKETVLKEKMGKYFDIF